MLEAWALVDGVCEECWASMQAFSCKFQRACAQLTDGVPYTFCANCQST